MSSMLESQTIPITLVKRTIHVHPELLKKCGLLHTFVEFRNRNTSNTNISDTLFKEGSPLYSEDTENIIIEWLEFCLNQGSPNGSLNKSISINNPDLFFEFFLDIENRLSLLSLLQFDKIINDNIISDIMIRIGQCFKRLRSLIYIHDHSGAITWEMLSGLKVYLDKFTEAMKYFISYKVDESIVIDICKSFFDCFDLGKITLLVAGERYVLSYPEIPTILNFLHIPFLMVEYPGVYHTDKNNKRYHLIRWNDSIKIDHNIIWFCDTSYKTDEIMIDIIKPLANLYYQSLIINNN